MAAADQRGPHAGAAAGPTGGATQAAGAVQGQGVQQGHEEGQNMTLNITIFYVGTFSTSWGKDEEGHTEHDHFNTPVFDSSSFPPLLFTLTFLRKDIADTSKIICFLVAN